MNSAAEILELSPTSAEPQVQEHSSGTELPSDPVSAKPKIDPTNPLIQPSADPAPVHPCFSGNRGNGKVARLPKDIREHLNNMILDGVSYAEIIRRLGEPAEHLKPDNIHQWKKYGYQDWLLEREWLERVSSKAEFSTDVLAAPDSSNLHEAGLRIAAAQMFDQLMRFNAASQNGASDQPEKFARLVNALSRLTREALAFQKYRDALAKAIVELKECDPDRDLVANELLMLVNKMDHTFKVARPNLDQLLAEARRRAHETLSENCRRRGNETLNSEPQPAVAPSQPVQGSKPQVQGLTASEAESDSDRSRPGHETPKNELLINTPIHRGANDAQLTSTVSTVSDSDSNCSRRAAGEASVKNNSQMGADSLSAPGRGLGEVALQSSSSSSSSSLSNPDPCPSVSICGSASPQSRIPP
jgi:hypothetical protein